MEIVHCLDFLRQAVMCQGDMTPIVLVWAKEQAVPIGDVGYQHSCASWQSIQKWVIDREVDIYKPGLVVHPVYGPAYANMSSSSHRTGLATASPLHSHPAD